MSSREQSVNTLHMSTVYDLRSQMDAAWPACSHLDGFACRWAWPCFCYPAQPETDGPPKSGAFVRHIIGWELADSTHSQHESFAHCLLGATLTLLYSAVKLSAHH